MHSSDLVKGLDHGDKPLHVKEAGTGCERSWHGLQTKPEVKLCAVLI